MRLFQKQPVYNPFDNNNPLPPPPPPFLADEEEERGLSLLRESTTHLREGRQRLPTPDKVAIMELSTSFDKRRLGKQQQILSEITQRCREQEVTDLSSKISAKVALTTSSENQKDLSPLQATPGMRRRRSQAGRHSPESLSPDLRDLDTIEARLQFEKGYKFFPARGIIRQPSRTQFYQATITGGGGEGDDTQRDTATAAALGTRPNTDHIQGARSMDPEALERQTTKGSMMLPSSVQPSLSTVPPLLLADVQGSDSRHPDRIGYYFSSSRLPLSQRSRTYFDMSRNSHRGFRTLPVTGKSTGGRQQMKSVRSEKGLHNIIQHILADMSVGLQLGNRRERSRELALPMGLNSSAATGLRPETHRV